MAVTFVEPIQVISSIDTSYTESEVSVSIGILESSSATAATGEMADISADLTVVFNDVNGVYAIASLSPIGSVSATASGTPLFDASFTIAPIASISGDVSPGGISTFDGAISFGPWDLGGFAEFTSSDKLFTADLIGAPGFLFNATSTIKPIGDLTASCTVSNTFSFESAIAFTLESSAVAGDLMGLNGAIGYAFELDYLAGQIAGFDRDVSLGITLTATTFEDVVAESVLSLGDLLHLSSDASAPLTSFVSAWAINTSNKAHSTYSNFAPNSMAVFNGKSLAAFADGIYELTGDKDDTAYINAVVRTSLLDYGSPNVKYVPDLYLHGRDYSGDLAVTVTADETTEVSYQVPYDGQTGIRNRRVKLAKGVRGRSWQFEVRNVSGCMMELESIEAPVAVSQRRI